MKWELQPSQQGACFVLSTNRPLPWMFDDRHLKRSPYWISDLLHRASPRCRLRFAQRVARRNRGRVPFELVFPAKTYHDLLAELAALEGIIEIRDLHRYALQVQYGQLFEPLALGTAIARTISWHLYPGESLEFAGGFDSKQGGHSVLPNVS